MTRVKSQVVGLRYFNVYGPRENHKGEMASVIHHFNQQLFSGDKIKLFSGYDGYADGEQLRDFVFVEDVVKVNLWFWAKKGANGIYNVGTGKAQTFNTVGQELIKSHKHGQIEYIPFPDKLKNTYQNFTQADLTSLRSTGCNVKFKNINNNNRLSLLGLTG